MLTPRCKYKCQFIQITDNLFLCPHAAYGSASDRLGAVEEARHLLERQGGYDAVLARVQEAHQRKLEELQRAREDKDKQLTKTLKYR
jgi:geranylgeranyl pyrophosphate synthase